MKIQNQIFDINQYFKTISLINKFLNKKEEIFKTFFSEDTSGFFRQEKKENYVNLTSTSTCIISLDRLKKKIEVFTSFSKEKLRNKIFERERWDSTGLNPNNAYTLSLLLPGLRFLLEENDWKLKLKLTQIDRIEKGLTILENVLLVKDPKNKNLKIWDYGGVYVYKYPPSSFLTYWTLKTLKAYDKFYEKKFEKTYNWALFTFYKEISLYNSKDLENFDVFQLAYSLMILIKFFNPDLPKCNILHALEIIFRYQNDIGRWDKKHPLFHYPKAGSAYCHDFEMLRSLLEELKENYLKLILNFLPNLHRILNWVEINYQESTLKNVSGWSSGHDPQWPYPESWATAAVMDFLYEFKQILKKQSKSNVLQEFGYFEGNLSKIKSLDDLLDSKIKNKERYEFLIEDNLKKIFIKGRPREELAKGIIFCGPPGTGKSTLARSIAKTINWKFIEISPGKFIEKNIWNIGQTTREIFEKIRVLDNVVILFDELDELVRKRGTETEMLSRFMTTTMLPHFQKLSQQKKVIFIIATNRIGDFDLAIQRPGRFNLILNINQPARSKLIEEFKKILSEYQVPKENIMHFINFLNWEWYKEQLLETKSKGGLLEDYLDFDKKYQSDSLLDKFFDLLRQNHVQEENIENLMGIIEQSKERDGYIEADPENARKQIEYYKNHKLNNLNEIFNRFTFTEIEPFIVNELMEVLMKDQINFEDIRKKFEQINNELVLTGIIKKPYVEDKEERLYWRTRNRISMY